MRSSSNLDKDIENEYKTLIIAPTKMVILVGTLNENNKDKGLFAITDVQLDLKYRGL